MEIKEIKKLNRRNFLQLSAAFGTTAVLGGLLATGAAAGEKEVKQQISIQADQEKKKAAAAKHTLILGLDGFLVLRDRSIFLV